jgi:uncharacterized protein YndB with AHSA1/START domain
MPTASSTTDRIEKRVSLKAPQARVWRALADSAEFGAWFQIRFDDPFVEGRSVKGRILVPGYEHVTAEFQIVRVQPEDYFAYRWHPYAVDPARDYSSEPTTLVEFRLEPAGKETVLTVVESGFDRIPLERRAEAFRMNDGGWTAQVQNIANYVEAS